jgi:AcrR family transcriptional regulator
MERFAEAAEELLLSRTFEEISIQDIVRRAERPIGSFYARFSSKEALLPFLYERYHRQLEDWIADSLGRTRWDALGFEACVRGIVDFIVESYAERRGLIRALALFARARPEALPADLVTRRRRAYALPIAILARHRSRITHADPEAAARFGIYMVSSVARERLLFADMPLARVTAIRSEDLRQELVRALYAYLGGEAPKG